MELAVVAAWSFVVAVAGGFAGLVLGNLRLPVVVTFASSPQAGAGANVAISGLAALAAAIAHWRAGRVNGRLLAWMAPPSFAGGLAGGLVAGVLPERILLAAIAAVILYGAFEVRRHGNRTTPPPERIKPVAAVAVAALVGVLGGLVGLILGALRLPAMMRWAGVSPAGAIGTNAAIGVFVGIGGFAGHLATGIDWAILAVGAAAAVPGAIVGSRLTGRLDERVLLQGIAAVLVLAGLAVAVRAATG